MTTFPWIIIGFIFLVFIIFLIRKGIREADDLQLMQATLEIPHWPDVTKGFRILHVTDLHLNPGSNRGRLVLQLAEEANPDCVFITGDLIVNRGKGQIEALEFLKEIASRWPTFAVPGNKERFRKKHLRHPVEDWEAAGVTVLLNRAVPFHLDDANAVWVAGVDDIYTRRTDVAAALQEVPNGEPVFFLAHSPDIIRRDGVEKASVIFSGHTHGGQICLPGGRALYAHTSLPTKYASGTHRVCNGNTILVVSRGIGSTRLRMRLWCPPELTLWTISS